MPKARRE
jgi:hypothetical protein